jgi:outer membrane immunogenic protein
MYRTVISFLAAAGLSLALGQAASAADLPRGPVYKAPAAVLPYYNWTGFYIGAHGGYAWGDSDGAKLTGGFAGGQAGYNYQAAGSPWVFGLEVDSAWADIGRSDTLTAGGLAITGTSKIDYVGSFRGRIGYGWDRALLYGTGGLAWAHNQLSIGVAVPGFAAGISDDKTHLGWAVGAGLEYAFAPNWSAKVEYLFADYGSETYFANIAGGVAFKAQVNSLKGGINYKFGGPVVANY